MTFSARFILVSGLLAASMVFSNASHAAPHWGKFKRECAGPGQAKYSAALRGVGLGKSRLKACARLGARIAGRYYSRPNRCVNRVVDVRGEFYVNDRTCRASDKRIRKKELERIARQQLANMKDVVAIMASMRKCINGRGSDGLHLARKIKKKEKFQIEDLPVYRTCIVEPRRKLRARGFRSMAIGVGGDASAGIGGNHEQGVAFNTAGRPDLNYYQVWGWSVGWSAGVSVNIIVSAIKGNARDIGKPISKGGNKGHGFVGAGYVKGGGGVAIWYDYKGNLTGLSGFAGVGLEGKAFVYTRNTVFDLKEPKGSPRPQPRPRPRPIPRPRPRPEAGANPQSGVYVGRWHTGQVLVQRVRFSGNALIVQRQDIRQQAYRFIRVSRNTWRHPRGHTYTAFPGNVLVWRNSGGGNRTVYRLRTRSSPPPIVQPLPRPVLRPRPGIRPGPVLGLGVTSGDYIGRWKTGQILVEEVRVAGNALAVRRKGSRARATIYRRVNRNIWRANSGSTFTAMPGRVLVWKNARGQNHVVYRRR